MVDMKYTEKYFVQKIDTYRDNTGKEMCWGSDISLHRKLVLLWKKVFLCRKIMQFTVNTAYEEICRKNGIF